MRGILVMQVVGQVIVVINLGFQGCVAMNGGLPKIAEVLDPHEYQSKSIRLAAVSVRC